MAVCHEATSISFIASGLYVLVFQKYDTGKYTDRNIHTWKSYENLETPMYSKCTRDRQVYYFPLIPFL